MKALPRFKKWLYHAPFSIHNNLIMKIILLVIYCASISFTQTDWEKWEKANHSYQLPSKQSARAYNFNGGNASEVLINSFASAYWFFISDVDGDNCPFKPSCSSFLIASVKSTNIVQGTLMFFDRFTRDLNFVNRNKHYPFIEGGRFYDPESLYELDEEKIKYIPPIVTVAE